MAKKVFAILALLLCQLTIFAHVSHHAALKLDESCQICLHAPGLDAAAVAPLAIALELSQRQEFVPALRPAAVAAALPRYQPIRGPPSRFVS